MTLELVATRAVLARRTRVGLVGACLAAAVVLLALRWATPSDGTVVQLSNAVWRADQLRVDAVVDRSSALAAGDLVVGVDGQSLDALATGPSLDGSARPEAGHRYVFTVVRRTQTVQVPVVVERFPLWTFLLHRWPSLLFPCLLLVVGTYVFWRRPGDVAAQALFVIAGLVMPGTIGWLLGSQVATIAVDGPPTYLLLSEVPLALTWGVVLQFILAFPGGPSPLRRRGLQVTALLTPVVLYVGYLAVTLPAATSRRELAGRLLQVSLPSSTVLPVLATLLFVLVYRRMTDPAARRRALWIVGSLGLAAALWFAVWTLPALLGLAFFPDTAYVSLVLLPCPFAVGVAVLNLRLFDIDPVRRRLLIRVGTTALLVLVWMALAWWMTAVGLGNGTFALPLAVGLVAALTPPLNSWIRTALTRRVLGSRDQPHAVVTSLASSTLLEPGAEQLSRLTATLAAALKLDFVAIEVRGAGTQRLSGFAGVDRGAGILLPLTYGTEEVGTLRLDAGPSHELFGVADRELLATLQGHLSSITFNVLATSRLLAAREQLVLAREEQRRRLHHRLHDGLGASLAATKMKAEGASQLVGQDPARAAGLLNDVVAHCADMVEELREVVLDLRPPVLGQLGLAAAIRARALQLLQAGVDGRYPMQVEVTESGATDQPPAAVEIAVYWIAVEALNNAAHHSGATSCRVGLDWRTSPYPVLELSVTDNGVGIADDRHSGGGTVSMNDRAEELGGRLVIERPTTGGTRVRAMFPLRDRPET